MSVTDILLRLVTGPAELFYEMVCTLFLRLQVSPITAILGVSLAVCLLTTPLRPRSFAEYRKEKRFIPQLVLQLLCLAASWRWMEGTSAFPAASFGVLSTLGIHGGLILFWAGYAVFAVIRRFTGLGYTPMKLNARQRKTDRNNKILLALAGLYMTVLTGLLIPSEIVAASPQEFTDIHYYRDPARYLAASGLSAAGAFLLFGVLYGLLLSPKARKKYTLFMTVTAAWSAVNYMFFGRGYGIISSELRYEAFSAPGIGTVLINLAALAVAAAAVLLIRKKWPVVLRLAALYGCIALAVMTAVNINTIKNGVKDTAASAARQTGEKAAFTLSREGKNVMVIMLDRTISGFVPYFMNEKPELKEQFDGFTWYPNTLSYGYHTNIAAPALYGGYEYNPDGLAKRDGLTLQEKHNEALKVMPVNFLEAGYEVTVCDAPYANYQWIPDMSIYDDYPEIRTYNTIGTYNEYKEQTLEELDRIRDRNLFCYSLFRCAPAVLQGTVYDWGMYLDIDAWEDGVEGFELLGVSSDFMNSYMVMKNLDAMTKVTDEPRDTFLMLTNEMTHNVIQLQEPDYEPRRNVDNTEYEAEHRIRRTDDGRELDMAEASELVKIHYHGDMSAFLLLGKWFDELREQGVWDNTRIIVVSDHGCYLGLFGNDLREKYPELASSGAYSPEQWTDTMCYNPLLMVKDFGATGFTTDDRFMTNADTPVIAFDGLIDNPVNPFTENPVDGEGKNAPEQHLVESEWAISTNNGNFFSDPVWITFRGDNVFDADNWSVEK